MIFWGGIFIANDTISFFYYIFMTYYTMSFFNDLFST